MTGRAELQPVLAWKGLFKIFTCITAQTASKPKDVPKFQEKTAKTTTFLIGNHMDEGERFLSFSSSCAQYVFPFAVFQVSTRQEYIKAGQEHFLK
ncbi:E3 ubiquitin-protein ligase SIAH1-like isoform X1 [Arapaima gigas]